MTTHQTIDKPLSKPIMAYFNDTYVRYSASTSYITFTLYTLAIQLCLERATFRNVISM